MKKNLNIGDTIAINIKGSHLVSGIVYINSEIPMGKFYLKQFGMQYEVSDVYEDALVLIDNQNPGTLTVLTLEENNYKLFVWNDLFRDDNFKYSKINDGGSMTFDYEGSLLTEMTHTFK